MKKMFVAILAFAVVASVGTTELVLAGDHAPRHDSATGHAPRDSEEPEGEDPGEEETPIPSPTPTPLTSGHRERREPRESVDQPPQEIETGDEVVIDVSVVTE